MPTVKHTVTLTGVTNVSNPTSVNGTDYIFAGTSLNSAPTLNFMGGPTHTSPIPVYHPEALTVSGYGDVNLGTAGKTYGLQMAAKVDVIDGVQINKGQLSVFVGQASVLTLDGNSTIQNSGTLSVNSPRALGEIDVNGTVTVSAGGNNRLTTEAVVLGGHGTIVQMGESDITSIGWTVKNGLTFVVDGGALALHDVRDFHGTIGPISKTAGAPSLGIFGEVQLYTDAATAQFDTSTGMLHLLSATGADTGDIHLGGNAKGIVLNKVTLGGSTYIAMNDSGPPRQGNIPIKFS